MVRTRGGHTSRGIGFPFGEQNPGPDDNSVLRLQDQHRSEDVFHRTGNDELRVRRYHLLPLHPRVRPYIIQAGFIGLTQIGHIQINNYLISALLERWRRETHTFHLRVGEMAPTLQDVAMLLGLPIDGMAVTCTSSWVWEDLCQYLLGVVPPHERLKGGWVENQWLKEQFEHGPLDDATEQVLLQHARGYILHLIGSVLFTSNTGNWTPLIFLPLLETMEQCRSYSWGSAVLANLYRQMCRGCMKGAKQLGGCVLLLQHLHIGRPIVTSLHQHQAVTNDDPLPPLGARWSAALTFRDNPRHSQSFYRDQLDVQKPHQVDWTPYTQSQLATLPQVCFESQHIWRYVGSLISFDIVEMHCPDRVLRQFELTQHIPDPVDTVDSLHNMTHRGREDKNWVAQHATWIELWNSRMHSIAYERDPPTSSSEYMQWYLSITRRVITRREVHVPRRSRHGFDPSDNRLQRLVNITVDHTRRAARALLNNVGHEERSVCIDWLTDCHSILDVAGEEHQFHQILQQGVDYHTLYRATP